jgi:hypothetical protein
MTGTKFGKALLNPTRRSYDTRQYVSEVAMRPGIALICGLVFFSAVATAAEPTTAPGESTLLAIPDNSAQTKARDMIHNIFKEDYAKTTPAARQALAKRLVVEAAGTNDDLIARYVLLLDGSEMAAATGDADTALKAITELSKNYKIDAIELSRGALLRANAAATTPQAAEIIVRLSLETADAAALADSFDVVQQLVNIADAAANKTRKVTIVSQIQPHLADLRSLAAEYAQVRLAFDILTQKPDDTAAHTLIGKFYALHKGQWDIGLPHLARGGDPELKALATKELSSPVDGLDQTALGDAWWDIAEKSNGLARANAHKHAVMWYQKSQQSLSGITKTRIETRLREGLAAPAIKPSAASTTTTANAINLLALIDPTKDAAEGKWTLDANTLTVAPGKYAVLQLPYIMPDEFDLRVTFTRTNDDGPVEILLAAHKKAFGFALDVKGEARFERVANKIAKDNPTAVPIALTNGRKYTLTVQIRRDAIRALLDDKLLTQWKTDYKDLARYTLWKMPDEKRCGLGANGAKVTFHSVELIEITGKGKPTR